MSDSESEKTIFCSTSEEFEELFFKACPIEFKTFKFNQSLTCSDFWQLLKTVEAVSYTHLTLPTIYSV